VEDGDGKGRIHWLAVRADDDTQRAERDVSSLQNLTAWMWLHHLGELAHGLMVGPPVSDICEGRWRSVNSIQSGLIHREQLLTGAAFTVMPVTVSWLGPFGH
jgi:hypothetical protein